MTRRKWLDIALETATVAILSSLIIGLSLVIFYDVVSAQGIELSSYTLGPNICIGLNQNPANISATSTVFYQQVDKTFDGNTFTYAQATPYGIGGSGGWPSFNCMTADPTLAQDGVWDDDVYFVFWTPLGTSPYQVDYYIKYHYNNGVITPYLPSGSPFLGVDDFENLTGLATSTCGITNVTGCVQNAMAFLFYPSTTALEKFKLLQESAKTRAPFGYVYILLSSAQAVEGDSAPAFVLDINEDIQDAYFTPLKNAIATILWALAGFWFFKRIRDLQL